MEFGIKVYMYWEISINEAVENWKLGLKVYMCKEISIRMRRWRI